MSPRRFVYLFAALALLLLALPACSTSAQADLHLMPLEKMPEEVKSAPVTVQTAYQFAAANPEILQNIPCYCGCGDIGHASNYDCYVYEVNAEGEITFDHHALGCSICVDITQDVMRMLRAGKSPQEARAYIDATYSKYGPSNIP